VEKIIKTFRFIGWLIGIVGIIFFTSCRTIAVTDDAVLEHQRRIAALEGRIVDYERRISEYDQLVGGTVERLEIIRARANSITDRVDRIIFLFEEYEREVNNLINSFDRSGNSVSQIETIELLVSLRADIDLALEDYPYNSWLR
jgi:CHASE3 domain sensor protein